MGTWILWNRGAWTIDYTRQNFVLAKANPYRGKGRPLGFWFCISSVPANKWLLRSQPGVQRSFARRFLDLACRVWQLLGQAPQFPVQVLWNREPRYGIAVYLSKASPSLGCRSFFGRRIWRMGLQSCLGERHRCFSRGTRLQALSSFWLYPWPKRWWTQRSRLWHCLHPEFWE